MFGLTLLLTLTTGLPQALAPPWLLIGEDYPETVGAGEDGALTVTGTFKVDQVKTRLTATASAGSTQLQVASTSGFAPGQEVLVIQMTGSGQGAWETNYIQSVGSGVLNLREPLKNTYYATSASRAQVLKVPHYTDVTVESGGVLTVSGWNGNTGGVLFFRASGEVLVKSGGRIVVSGRGFPGGSGGSGGAGGSGGSGGAGGPIIQDGYPGGAVPGGGQGGAYPQDFRMVYSQGVMKLEKWTGSSWSFVDNIEVETSTSPPSIVFNVSLSAIANPDVQENTGVWFYTYRGVNSLTGELDRAPDTGTYFIASSIIPEIPELSLVVFLPAIVLAALLLYRRARRLAFINLKPRPE